MGIFVAGFLGTGYDAFSIPVFPLWEGVESKEQIRFNIRRCTEKCRIKDLDLKRYRHHIDNQYT